MAEGLRRVSRQEVIVADKTNAGTFDKGEKAIKSALKDIGTDYIDIMFLHNVPARSVERRDTSNRPYRSGNLQMRMGALKALIPAKGERDHRGDRPLDPQHGSTETDVKGSRY